MPKAKTSKTKQLPMPGNKKVMAFMESLHKEHPPYHSFSKVGFKRIIRLAELAGKLKERQRTYPPENRKKLDWLIKLTLDFDYQLGACSGNEAALRRHYSDRVDNLSPLDYWVYFKSSPASWKAMCGRAGWLVIDHEKLDTKAFLVVVLN